MDEICIHSQVMGINQPQLLSAVTERHVLHGDANLHVFPSSVSETADPQVSKSVTSSKVAVFPSRGGAMTDEFNDQYIRT